jgi:uncharacterized membrane protein
MLNPAADQIADKERSRPRIWEIDFLRGLSIILMVLYHLGYDLTEFCGIKRILGIEINLASPLLTAAQYFFAGVFIVLCGISSTLSRNNIRRALKILGVAVIITIVTHFYSSSETIYFGILHCLAVCILLYGLMLQKAGPLTCAASGALIIVLSAVRSLIIRNVFVDCNWLLPFGIPSKTLSSYDYFPLLPWLGVFLVGTALGKSVYAPKQSLIKRLLPESIINLAGRHSLLIYIVHQPILLAILYLLGLMRI